MVGSPFSSGQFKQCAQKSIPPLEASMRSRRIRSSSVHRYLLGDVAYIPIRRHVSAHVAQGGGVSLTLLWVIIALSRYSMPVVFRPPGVCGRGYGDLASLQFLDLSECLVSPRPDGMVLSNSVHSTLIFGCSHISEFLVPH